MITLQEWLSANPLCRKGKIPWQSEEGPSVEIWALHSSRRLVGVKIRAFLEVVAQTFPAKIYVPAR
jgi:hypothetical protein